MSDTWWRREENGKKLQDSLEDAGIQDRFASENSTALLSVSHDRFDCDMISKGRGKTHKFAILLTQILSRTLDSIYVRTKGFRVVNVFDGTPERGELKCKREEEKESDGERRRRSRRGRRRRRRIRGTATRFESEKEEREHVKNTENRREQVTPRSLALIRPRPSYKLRVCHRRRRKRTEGIGEFLFFFFPSLPARVQFPSPRVPTCSV